MTQSNWIELAVLAASLIVVFLAVRISSRKVADLDGLGEITVKEDTKGKIIAHF